MNDETMRAKGAVLLVAIGCAATGAWLAWGLASGLIVLGVGFAIFALLLR